AGDDAGDHDEPELLDPTRLGPGKQADTDQEQEAEADARAGAARRRRDRLFHAPDALEILVQRGRLAHGWQIRRLARPLRSRGWTPRAGAVRRHSFSCPVPSERVVRQAFGSRDYAGSPESS